MIKGQEEKRKAFMEHMKVTYGVIIEEFRLKSGQRCGFFHITFPVFVLDQEPGSEPIGYREPITEYTEAKMRQVLTKHLWSNEWYQRMCLEWRNNHPIVEDMQELTHIQEVQKWEKE